MTREEQIEVATATYINGRSRNNVPPEEIEEIRLAYQAGAIYADEHPNNPYKDVIEHMSNNTYRVWKQNLWHDAQGENLPPIDREVIVLCDDGKVCFGHRPNINGYVTVDGENLYPKTYDKGGWNIPNVRWWLDVELPNVEEATMKTYRHKKTGKPYLVITDNFMFKQDGKWLKGLVLYQTLYPNPDGMYFARTKEDFEENFQVEE